MDAIELTKLFTRFPIEDQYLYKYKVVLSVCLFVGPILSHEPLDRFASNFD